MGRHSRGRKNRKKTRRGRKRRNDERQVREEDIIELCSICWDSVEHDDHLSTSCGHEYHKKCLKRWLKASHDVEEVYPGTPWSHDVKLLSTCPNCRERLQTADARQLFSAGHRDIVRREIRDLHGELAKGRGGRLYIRLDVENTIKKCGNVLDEICPSVPRIIVKMMLHDLTRCQMKPTYMSYFDLYRYLRRYHPRQLFESYNLFTTLVCRYYYEVYFVRYCSLSSICRLEKEKWKARRHNRKSNRKSNRKRNYRRRQQRATWKH